MDAEGSLTVRVTTREERVVAVQIESTRRTDVARVFIGRQAADALRIVPTLFAVCGAAHATAALAACEQALGIEPSREARARRELRVALEALGSTFFQMGAIWPALVGARADVALLQASRSALEALVSGYPDLEPVQRLVRRLAPDESVDDDPDRVRAWATNSDAPSARLLAAVSRAGAEDFGRSDLPLVPKLDAAWYAPRIRQADFARLPTLDGSPAEASALSRVAVHPVVRRSLEGRGPTLVTRLLAHRVALRAGLAQVEAALSGAHAAGDEARLPLGTGRGVGVAETARGPLAHAVDLEGGKVAGWWTVAPTEWTFHPDGPLKHALLGAAGDNLAERTRWLVAALDPCVPCEVRVEEA